VPYAQGVLAPLALQTLSLSRDGSGGGRGSGALLLQVVDKGRALPLAWQVRKGKQGHFSKDRHSALVKQGPTLSPPGASVVWRGEGEFDGPTLQPPLQG
jgi:hypothetical protein